MRLLNSILLMSGLVALLTACGSGSSSKSSDDSLTGFANSQYSHLTSTEGVVCAQTKTGVLKCWGNGESYAFADGRGEIISDEAADSAEGGFPASQLGDEAPVFAMASHYHGCAIYDGGVLKCWGRKDRVGLNDLSVDASLYVGDSAEELGNNLPVIDLGSGMSVSSVSVGDSHICAVLNNGRLKCWGDNGDGRLGYGDTDWRGDDNDEMGDNLLFVDLGTDESEQHYTVKQVYAGYDRTCAILNNDQVKCWGENNYAQAGYGDFNDRGDEPDEMGNDLPFVDLGTGRSAKEVFAYYNHTCVILDNDALKCWGGNHEGEIGLGNNDHVVGNNMPYYDDYFCSTNTTTPLYTVTEVASGGETCGTAGGYRYDVGVDSDGNEVLSAEEISRSDYMCHREGIDVVYKFTAVAANESVQCGTDPGLLLEYDFDNDGDGVMAKGEKSFMGDALPEINLGSSSPVVDVVQGDDHTCVLLADTTLKCWGSNEYGQFGLDSTETKFGTGDNETPAAQLEVDLGDGLHAVAIAGGYNHTCALLNNDEIKCWGYDEGNGTLGVAEYFDTAIGDGTPELEMGNALQTVPVFVETVQ